MTRAVRQRIAFVALRVTMFLSRPGERRFDFSVPAGTPIRPFSDKVFEVPSTLQGIRLTGWAHIFSQKLSVKWSVTAAQEGVRVGQVSANLFDLDGRLLGHSSSDTVECGARRPPVTLALGQSCYGSVEATVGGGHKATFARVTLALGGIQGAGGVAPESTPLVVSFRRDLSWSTLIFVTSWCALLVMSILSLFRYVRARRSRAGIP